ncbi:MAG: hypothetical protein AB7R40_23565 [Nitrospiraceae bacterium]
MAITTYAELQTAAANWLARTNLTDRIPEFIGLAEAKFNRALRCIQMEARSYASTNILYNEPEFVSLPGDFQTMRRIRLSSVTGKPSLQFLAGRQADEYRTSLGNNSGRPTHYTIFGDEIELIPTPSEDYTLEMVYRRFIPALADDNTSNWLLALAPDAYLYGTLMEAAPYMKDDARIPVWAAGLTYAMDGLNTLSNEQAYMSGPTTVTLEGCAP